MVADEGWHFAFLVDALDQILTNLSKLGMIFCKSMSESKPLFIYLFTFLVDALDQILTLVSEL